MTDADLIAVLEEAAHALDEEAAFVIDVEVDDRGRSRGTVPARDQHYFEAVTETAGSLRCLVEMIRRRRTP